MIDTPQSPTPSIDIPVDVHESLHELIVIVPLGGVEKSSVHITLQESKLLISGVRVRPDLKEWVAQTLDECYRGNFQREVRLPSNIYYDKIQSTLTRENILIVTVPKILIPETVDVHVSE